MAKKKATLCPCLICKSGKCGVCTPAFTTPPDFPILEHKLITSEYDVMALDIVNWRGLNGSWSNPGDALRTIASWFINLAHATILQIDLEKAPERGDFPGWDHVGDHPRMGRLYWNWFHHNHDGELYFSDSPDFYGTLRTYGLEANFYGDIERVSAQALAGAQKHLHFGDIWISVFEKKQVIIEPMASLAEIWGKMLGIKRLDVLDKDDIANQPDELITVAKPQQLSLFGL